MQALFPSLIKPSDLCGSIVRWFSCLLYTQKVLGSIPSGTAVLVCMQPVTVLLLDLSIFAPTFFASFFHLTCFNFISDFLKLHPF